MEIINIGGRTVALFIVFFIAQTYLTFAQPPSNAFPCNKMNSKPQTPGDPSSKHTVALTWNPSVSLSNPPAQGEGYNIYRLNPDGSCTKLNLYPLKPDGSYTKMNEDLIRGTVVEDWFVEPDKIYRYVATAVKQNSESSASNYAEVKIPTP